MFPARARVVPPAGRDAASLHGVPAHLPTGVQPQEGGHREEAAPPAGVTVASYPCLIIFYSCSSFHLFLHVCSSLLPVLLFICLYMFAHLFILFFFSSVCICLLIFLSCSSFHLFVYVCSSFYLVLLFKHIYPSFYLILFMVFLYMHSLYYNLWCVFVHLLIYFCFSSSFCFPTSSCTPTTGNLRPET